MQAKYSVTLGLVSLLAACSPGRDGPGPVREDSLPQAVTGVAPAGRTVLVLGTSLTAGYGLGPEVAWPAVLQRKIDSAGLGLRVVNAGVSGETSAGAVRRTDWLLERERPAVLILETGGNDGLRGIEPDSMGANLRAVLEKTRRLPAPPALVIFAMEAPPNLGDAYTSRFRAVFSDVARETGATLVPFFLEGVAGVDSLNLPDGIHPTARGHELAAANVWRVLEPLLRQIHEGGPR